MSRTRGVDATVTRTGTNTYTSTGVDPFTSTRTYRDILTNNVQDVVPGPGPFNLTRQKNLNITVTGNGPWLSGYDNYENWPLDSIGNDMTLGIFLAPLTDQQASNRLAARTNPLRPEIDLPVFLAELRDIPRILTFLREKGPAFFASGNLTWQFGLRPLISDLQRMFTFVSLVDKRMQLLTKLHGAEGLRMRYVIKKDARITLSARSILGPGGGRLNGSLKRASSINQWGVITYHAIPGVTTRYSRREVSRIVFGITFDSVHGSAKQLWELVPWSWMIDWYTDLGDLIEANRGYTVVRTGQRWLMTHQRVEDDFTVLSNSIPRHYTVSMTGTGAYIERKRRLPALAPALTVNLPFITAGQASILASLAVMKHPALRPLRQR